MTINYKQQPLSISDDMYLCVFGISFVALRDVTLMNAVAVQQHVMLLRMLLIIGS